MLTMEKIQGYATLGQLSFDELDRVFTQENIRIGSSDPEHEVLEIRAIRDTDGKPVLRANVCIVESVHEAFDFYTCVHGEDDADIYVTHERSHRDGRGADAIATGTRDDVDAYLRANADVPVRIEMDVRADSYWYKENLRFREEQERKTAEEARAAAERAAKAADPAILAAETAAAEAYGEHCRHAINAARKRCHPAYVTGLIAKAEAEAAKVEYNVDLLKAQTVRLRYEDVSAGWAKYRDPCLTIRAKSAIRDVLLKHKYQREVPVGEALRLIEHAYGYEWRRD